MESITRALQYKGTNFKYVGNYHVRPHAPVPHALSVENHKAVLRKAYARYLQPWDYDKIINSYRRSIATEESIMYDFFSGDIPYHDIPKDEHYTFALNYTLDAFRPPQKCRPCHIFDVQYHYPFKWNVNSEPPFSTDKSFIERLEGKAPKFGVQKNEIFRLTRDWHHTIKDDPSQHDRLRWPMLLHTKTAIIKDDDPNKMRTIWGMPKPDLIASVMIYWEYFAWIKRNPGSTPMLWGYETLTGGWFRLNHELYSSLIRASYWTLDWKRFDKFALFDAIRDLIYGVREYLDFEHGYVPTSNYQDTESTWTADKARRLQNLWQWTTDNIFKLPIVIPDGTMWERQFAGIPSGLYLTQLLDSLYNLLMLVTILHALGLPINEHTIIKVQGDDSIFRLTFIIPPGMHDFLLDALQDKADYYFKSIISKEKSAIGNSLNGAEVLGYRNLRGLPFRDDMELLASFYHTKAKKPTPERTMAQCIGIPYADMAQSDRLYDICLDVYEHYLHQGYTPDPSGLDFVFKSIESGIRKQDIPLTHFPSKFEIQRHLTSLHYDNTHTLEQFWPTSHFLRSI